MASNNNETKGEGGKRKGMSRNARIWLTILVVIIVGAAVVFFLRARAQANAASTYQTTTIQNGTLTATIGATGNVRANQTAIITWQTTGTVDGVDVGVGDQVKAGDVLASLSTTSLSQNIVLAQADLVTAQRNLDSVMQSSTPARPGAADPGQCSKKRDQCQRHVEQHAGNQSWGDFSRY